jgi:hypothetical protein
MWCKEVRITNRNEEKTIYPPGVEKLESKISGKSFIRRGECRNGNEKMENYLRVCAFVCEFCTQ